MGTKSFFFLFLFFEEEYVSENIAKSRRVMYLLEPGTHDMSSV